MMEQIAAASPRLLARITGLLYLLTIVTGAIAQGFISEKMIVFSDATATATNIMTNRSLFLLGFTIYLIEMACQIAITSLFYDLLKPVSPTVSRVTAFLGLAGCIIKTVSRLFYLAPLLLLGNTQYLSVFNTEQLQALALLFLKINDQGAAIGLAFFGFAAILKGYLIFQSTFLPRILGLFSILAGLGLLTFLSPPLGYRLFIYIALCGLVGSILQIFWLLVFGVNAEKWKEQASTATII